MPRITLLTTFFSKYIAIVMVALILFSGCASAPFSPATPNTSEVEKNTSDATDEINPQDAQQAISSAVPNTDILLFKIDLNVATAPVKFIGNVTQRPGYDNQPSFIRGTNDFLFSSIADGRQSDVYRYRSSMGKITKITDTPLSEYSPTPLQSGEFSCVTVEEDGAQRLWRFDHNGTPIGKFRPDIIDVGYHAFIPITHSAQWLAVFRVTDPVRLDVVTAHTSAGSGNQAHTLATGIGRSLHAIPNSARLSFVQHTPEQPSMLMEWNSLTNQISTLVEMPDEVEDMTWSADGRALTIVDGRLMTWADGDKTWSVLYELNTYLPFGTTRLAVNDAGTRLAVVMEIASNL